MSKSIFGFDKVEVVTKTVLKQRIKYLEEAIASGKWNRNPDKRFNAQKVAAYYRWQITHDSRFAKKRGARAA